MAYAAQTPSAPRHLREKLAQAVYKKVVPLLGTSGNGPLAEAIVANPKPGIEGLFVYVQADATLAITVESTDATLDAAVIDGGSIDLLNAIYGNPT